MKTSSIIDIYEIDGQEVSPFVEDTVPKLQVRSHWNRRNLCVLIMDGKEYTVSCSDLTRAIRVAEKAFS